MTSVDHLKQILAETLSADMAIQKSAADRLRASRTVPGHLLQVLQLIANDTAGGGGGGIGGRDAAIRQAAAVHFKNTIKVGWDVDREDGNEGIVISIDDRDTIRTHLVQLMCTVPPQIQAQLSESISLIAQVDYPDRWQNLLPELVQQFQSSDPLVVVGVLKTANSIFKSFRYVERSDELYRVIIYSLEGIQVPLLALFKSTGQAVDAMANDPHRLVLCFEALRLMCRIFFSLNYQDLPEFFEDHMNEFVMEFVKYLQYQNPVLIDNSEEFKASPIDTLQVAIIEILSLYADKDEEPFLEYLPNFTTLVWNLLMNVSSAPKHDSLATCSIRFLTSLVKKAIHRDLFSDESTLRQIVVRIVIPNLTFRESDEERFEDDPHEYMLTEVEGSDSETRRKCSEDLLKAMCQQFEAQTTAICSEHVGRMLAEYGRNPNEEWAAKDAAIHLMMGIAIRGETQFGVSRVNENVNLMDFFNSHILPELRDPSHLSRPVVKATSIKFVSAFRNQFSKEQLVQLMHMLIVHLGSPIVVVHTFAAYALERILFMKEVSTEPGLVGKNQPKIGNVELRSVVEPLFNALFSIVDNTNENENDYVMKCVMRSLANAGVDVIPVTQVVITKLTAALGRVAKNPRKPQFNHFLFESIAVLIKSVCTTEPAATSSFELLLFEPFTFILQADIAEFTPYVFQILAQLLEYRPTETGLGEGYQGLFQPLLSAALWEKRGNVPALTRLMQAYIRNAAPELVPQLKPILGVFQKLHSVKATEMSAFDILSSSIAYFPQQEMRPYLGTIFGLLLTRLQNAKTPRYVRLVTSFFALFVGKYGAQALIDLLDGIQNGLLLILLIQVWNPRMKTDPPVQRMEAKIQVIGVTKLLCECPSMLADDRARQAWADTLQGLVMLLTSSTFKASSLRTDINDGDDGNDVEIGYDAQFSQLNFAKKPIEDLLPEIADPVAYFVQSLHRCIVSTDHDQMLLPLIQQGLSVDPKLASGLELMFQNVGLSLRY